MTETEVIRSMVLSFRLLELQDLLLFAGKSKLGKKSELQNRALELITKSDKKLFNKIRDLSNAMYKQLGSSPSVNPYSQNYGNDTNEKASSGKTSNSNLETRTHASTRSQASDARGSTTSTQPIQDEPLELTVQKTSSGEKAKSSKKQPKTAPIL